MREIKDMGVSANADRALSPSATEPQSVSAPDGVTIADALQLASEALASHPGYHADVTFAEIWRWLAKKDAALEAIAKATGAA